MSYSPLREHDRKDLPENGSVEEPMRGIKYEYNFSGKRLGPDGFIELYLTCMVWDYKGNTFLRKSVYWGNKDKWKDVIRGFIIQHLNDVRCGNMLVRAIMRDFEVENSRYIPLDRYNQ